MPVSPARPIVHVWWLEGRGWWDQGLLQRMLDGREWVVPCGFEFREHVAEEPLEGDEGILVVPGRFAEVEKVQAILDRMLWAVVVVTSDEESLFPWWELRHDRLRLWVQTPDRDGDFQPIGEFFAEGFPDRLVGYGDAPGKITAWSFAGQVTHERRREAVSAMQATGGLSGELWLTERFLDDEKGLSLDDYAALLARSRVVPCPSGPETPDTFRGWEALEAGALPILDERTPRDDRPGYWNRLIGDAPIPRISDWRTLPDVVDDLLMDWPRNANRAQAWWLGFKRDLAWRLRSDVLDAADAPTVTVDLRDLVTVVVPTSPIPSHPGLDVVRATIESVRRQLPDSEILVLADGVRDEQEHLRGDYEEHLRRLLWTAAHEWRNVLPVIADEHLHQAGTAREAIDLVRTPLLLFVEHDTPLTDHELPWDGLCRAVLSGAANSVRFHHEAHVLDDHRYLMLDDEPVLVEGVPMLRTIQWSQRPHLASTEFYRTLLRRHFPPSSRTMIEDRMHSVAQRLPWDQTKLWLYAPEGDMKRSLHLDGRAGEPKFEMRYR